MEQEIYDDTTAREAWAAFMRMDELERQTHRRRERAFLVSVCSFAFWVTMLMILLRYAAGNWTALFPRALEISNKDFAKFSSSLDWKTFNEKLSARAPAPLSLLPSLLPTILPPWAHHLLRSAQLLLRTHTPYVRIDLGRAK